MLLGLLCVSLLVTPFLIYLIGSYLDRAHIRRDQQIQEKCAHLATLFEEVRIQNRNLARVYLQAANGDAYPYDLFMVEYYGGEHPVDTIWLPVRDFLNAPDAEIKQLLARELTHPGKYTIPDWEEALYQYVMHRQQAPPRKPASLWSNLLSGR